MLSSAAAWQLDDLCELTDWLTHHDAAADAQAVLQAAGGGRSVAEIAMLVYEIARPRFRGWDAVRAATI